MRRSISGVWEVSPHTHLLASLGRSQYLSNRGGGEEEEGEGGGGRGEAPGCLRASCQLPGQEEETDAEDEQRRRSDMNNRSQIYVLVIFGAAPSPLRRCHHGVLSAEALSSGRDDSSST